MPQLGKVKLQQIADAIAKEVKKLGQCVKTQTMIERTLWSLNRLGSEWESTDQSESGFTQYSTNRSAR
jgi:hypothetical protein